MNQDFVYATDDQIGTLPNLYIVADGMGGHRAGDFASRFTVTESVSMIKKEPNGTIRDTLLQTVQDVNGRLFKESNAHYEYYGCGTTIVAAVVEGDTLHVINVGDSRLYLLGAESGAQLEQVTVDHSLVEEMILAGSLDKKGARTHPEKNVITRAVGVEPTVEIDYFVRKLQQGELALLCSDGLCNMLEDEEMQAILQKPSTLEEKTRELVQTANDRGGNDNITAIVINTGEVVHG